MARKKYTEDQRDDILRSFVRAARQIIDEEGVEAISIRKLAAITGYNSAKLYFYFDSMEDLVAMACMSYLEKYGSVLVKDMPKLKSAKEFWLHSWKLFLHFAFENPEIYYHIFFAKREKSLQETMKEYFRLYPGQTEEMDENLRNIFTTGSLIEREYIYLDAMAAEGEIDKKHVKYIVELTTSYFKFLLEQKIAKKGGSLESEEMIEHFMGAVYMLLGMPEA